MLRKAKRISIEKAAGRKQEAPANSANSYVIYDSCYKCPMLAYMDAVCDDNLQALVAEGAPDEDVLKEAKIGLITEFAHLSGNTQTSAVNSSLARIYQYQSRLIGLGISYEGIVAGLVDEVVPYLNAAGIRTTAKAGDKAVLENLLRKIDTEVRKIKTKLKIEMSNYENMASRSGGGKISKDDFSEQRAALSLYLKFPVSFNVSAAEYAGYIKQYTKIASHG